MKKPTILVIIGCVTIILVSSFFVPSLDIFNDNKDYVEYNYNLTITTKKEQSYILWISIPEGWEEFSDSLKEKSENINFTLTDIDGQPALNVTGKGNTSLRFYMECENEMTFSFVKNWDRNGTKVYLDRSGSPPVSILMENTLVNHKNLYDSEFRISTTLHNDGWQYVDMTLSES